MTWQAIWLSRSNILNAVSWRMTPWSCMYMRRALPDHEVCVRKVWCFWYLLGLKSISDKLHFGYGESNIRRVCASYAVKSYFMRTTVNIEGKVISYDINFCKIAVVDEIFLPWKTPLKIWNIWRILKGKSHRSVLSLVIMSNTVGYFCTAIN